MSGAGEASWAPARKKARRPLREKQRLTPRSDPAHPSAWPEKRKNKQELECLSSEQKVQVEAGHKY